MLRAAATKMPINLPKQQFIAYFEALHVCVCVLLTAIYLFTAPWRIFRDSDKNLTCQTSRGGSCPHKMTGYYSIEFVLHA